MRWAGSGIAINIEVENDVNNLRTEKAATGDEMKNKMASGVAVLALDVMGGDPLTHESAFKTVRALSRAFDSKVLATSVFSPQDFSWPVEFDDEGSGFDSFAEDQLKEFMSALHESFDCEAAFRRGLTPKDEAKAISEVAVREHATAIFIITHVHDRPQLIGGFTNELVKSGQFPILAINAEAKAVTQIKTIVIATDFSEVSNSAYLDARHLAKKTGAKLVIFHRLESPFAADVRASFGILSSLTGLDEELVLSAEKSARLAENMTAKDKAESVDSVYEFSPCFTSVVDSVIAKCEEHDADLLIMGLKTRRAPLHAIGGIVTSVLAKSQCPVLLMREH
jgi:nucleotide-binding universal stress UspA family protein